MQYIPTYLENRRNPDNISYEFEALRPVLTETYGVIVYQEQCMRMVMALAGYQKHHSDSFRKAIAKKKADLIAQHREWFIDGRKADPKKGIDEIPGGVKMGHPREKLEKLYDQMEEFGKYSFNKSHAASYAVIGYVTAWLKYYYPAEFMAALMDSVIKNKSQVARYINHCKKELSIPVVSPDINQSMAYFVAEPDHSIVYSLAAKGASNGVLEGICDERATNGPFQSFEEFLIRCAFTIERKTLEALIAIGAFNKLGVVRSQALAGLDDISDRMQKAKNAVKRSQEPIKTATKINDGLKPKRPPKMRDPVTFSDRFSLEGLLPNITEFPDEALLSLEKEYLGVYLSGHPLYSYMFSIQNSTNFKISDMAYDVDEETGDVVMLNNVADGTRVQMIVVLNNVQEVVTRKDKKQMGIAVIEDLTGTGKVVIFPQLYDECRHQLREGDVYMLQGRLSVGTDEAPAIIAEKIEVIEATLTTRAVFTVPDFKSLMQVYEQLILKSARGDDPVYIDFNNVRILLKKDYWIRADLFKQYVVKDVTQYMEISKW